MPFGSIKCPVDDEEKLWIEEAILWLVEQFGSKALCEAEVILPSEEYFPDKYIGTMISAEKVVWRVCEYMGVDPSEIRVQIYEERQGTPLENSSLYDGKVRQRQGTAGTYRPAGKRRGKRQGIVALEASKLKDPPSVVATAAHEIGHHLLDGRPLPRDALRREYLTDLVPIFLGLGILTANVAFQFSQWQHQRRYGWEASRQGYLSEEMYGYALACFAWMRGEEKPAWAHHLTLNVRTLFKKSLKYLNKTGDTLLPVYVDERER